MRFWVPVRLLATVELALSGVSGSLGGIRELTASEPATVTATDAPTVNAACAPAPNPRLPANPPAAPPVYAAAIATPIIATTRRESLPCGETNRFTTPAGSGSLQRSRPHGSPLTCAFTVTGTPTNRSDKNVPTGTATRYVSERSGCGLATISTDIVIKTLNPR